MSRRRRRSTMRTRARRVPASSSSAPCRILRAAQDSQSRFNSAEASRTWSQWCARARGPSPDDRPPAGWPQGSCGARAIGAERSNPPSRTSNGGWSHCERRVRRRVEENFGQILDGPKASAPRKRAGMVSRREPDRERDCAAARGEVALAGSMTNASTCVPSETPRTPAPWSPPRPCAPWSSTSRRTPHAEPLTPRWTTPLSCF